MSSVLALPLWLALAGAAPHIVAPMDGGKVPAALRFLEIRAEASGEESGSARATRFVTAPLEEGQFARATLAKVPEGARGYDGVTLWVKGNRSKSYLQVLLQPAGGEQVYASRLLLANPYWHRVYLPFSEFYDRASVGTYPVRRFDRAAGALSLLIEVEGPSRAPVTFVLDEVGFTTAAEVERALGWRTFMPPGHGFPSFIDRFDGKLEWSPRGSAAAALMPIPDLPAPGFERGLRVTLAPGSAVARPLPRLGELPYYEGFGFWVKGDGQDHTIDVRLNPAGAAPFVFRTPVRGAGWKLVFAGFENFLRDGKPFEAEDAEGTGVVLSVALAPAEQGSATLTLGPMRFGYEQ